MRAISIDKIVAIQHFVTQAVEDGPVPAVILERNGTRIGFAINGGDASQEGAAIRVTNIGDLKEEFDAKGTPTANWRVDNRDGEQHQVFFVVAPDGLCYYFHEPLAQS